ncbi:MAG: phosphatidylglycerophosphatase A [candidate division Zixibacteria bacterium]|nr:phosphatidylglycerophosphatase A [candidate division Zixibacteria bacterium]
MKKTLVTLVATGLYTGYSPVVAGTVGSIPPLLIAYFLIGDNQLYLSLAALVTILISFWAASEAECVFGHDSKKIVIDEWAGMLITLLFLPVTIKVYLIAFAAFRFFDVIKLWPAGAAERLPGGFGVTTDDIVAGIQANLAVQLYLYLMRLWG